MSINENIDHSVFKFHNFLTTFILPIFVGANGLWAFMALSGSIGLAKLALFIILALNILASFNASYFAKRCNRESFISAIILGLIVIFEALAVIIISTLTKDLLVFSISLLLLVFSIIAVSYYLERRVLFDRNNRGPKNGNGESIPIAEKLKSAT